MGAFLFFVAFLLTFQLFRIMRYVVQKSVDWVIVLELMMHIGISLVPMAMPLAGFFAIVYAMGKLSEDSEVIAMKSFGFSKYKIFLPFLITGILLAGVLLKINQNIIPYSQAIFKNQMVRLSSKSLLSEIKPNQFFTDIPQVTLFSEKVTGEGKNLEKVFMSFEMKDMEQVITAERGKLIVESPKEKNTRALPRIYFHLFNGVLLKSPQSLYKNTDRRMEKINFNEYFFPITNMSFESSTASKDSMLSSPLLKKKIQKFEKRLEKEKNTKKQFELRKSIAKSKLEFFSRWNAPIQFMLFLLVGFCIGQKNIRSENQKGASKGFLFILIYFLFFFFGISQAKKLVILPSMAIFIPTVIGLAYGIYLFRKLDWNS